MCLDDFVLKQKKFSVQLNGFGCFEKNPNKVIFVRMEKCEPMNELHEKLMAVLRGKMNFLPKETPLHFHPHMTVAYRDLSNEQFELAWKEYEIKKYESTWEAKSICLMKHNFKTWEILKEFRFKQDLLSL